MHIDHADIFAQLCYEIEKHRDDLQIHTKEEKYFVNTTDESFVISYHMNDDSILEVTLYMYNVYDLFNCDEYTIEDMSSADKILDIEPIKRFYMTAEISKMLTDKDLLTTKAITTKSFDSIDPVLELIENIRTL